MRGCSGQQRRATDGGRCSQWWRPQRRRGGGSRDPRGQSPPPPPAVPAKPKPHTKPPIASPWASGICTRCSGHEVVRARPSDAEAAAADAGGGGAWRKEDGGATPRLVLSGVGCAWVPGRLLVQAHAKHGCVPGADADPVGRGKGRLGSKTSVAMSGGDSRSGSVLDTTGTVTTVSVRHHDCRSNRRKRGGSVVALSLCGTSSRPSHMHCRIQFATLLY